MCGYTNSNDLMIKVISLLKNTGDIVPGDMNINIYEKALERLLQMSSEYEHYQMLTKRVIEYQHSKIAELQNELWKLRGQTQNTENEVNRGSPVALSLASKIVPALKREHDFHAFHPGSERHIWPSSSRSLSWLPFGCSWGLSWPHLGCSWLLFGVSWGSLVLLLGALEVLFATD